MLIIKYLYFADEQRSTSFLNIKEDLDLLPIGRSDLLHHSFLFSGNHIES